MSTSTPPEEKKGLSGLAIAGIGCLVILAIALLGGGLLVAKGCSKFKEIAGDLDFQKDPAKAAALMALRLNPDIEIISTDDTKREVTFKTKSKGEVTTVSFDDLQDGKFTIKNAKGEVITVDGSANDGKGTTTVKGPDGSTVIGGDAAGPPPRR